MILPILCLLGSSLPTSRGISGCLDITGVWVNRDKDHIHLLQDEDQPLYQRTFKGIHHGIKNKENNYIEGSIGYLGMVAFTVLFTSDDTATTWIGQCMSCGGKDMMNMTLIHRVIVKDCPDNWKATRINTEIFTKTKEKIKFDRPSFKAPKESEKVTRSYKCDLTGTWWDQRQAMLTLKVGENWILEGNISTSLTKEFPNETSPVYGRWDSNDATSAFGFYWFPNMKMFGHAVVGLVGQCLFCERKNILDTVWILLMNTRYCKDIWYRFQVSYSRYSQNRPDTSSRLEMVKPTTPGPTEQPKEEHDDGYLEIR